MKKFLVVMLAVVMSFSIVAFTACNKTGEEVTTLRFAVPDGATALSVAKLVNDGSKVGEETIDVAVVSAALIGAEVGGEKADIAIMPTNAAANVINKGGKYKIVATNIFGVLYLVGQGDMASFSLNDLPGTVVLSIGQKNTPQYVFEAILNENHIAFDYGTTAVADKVIINFVADGSAVIGGLDAGTATFGVLGEPAVTNAAKKGYNNLFDLQQGYANTLGVEALGYPQASLVVKTSVLEARPDFIEKLLVELESGVEWLNVESNKGTVTSILSNAGSVTTFPVDSIARCNVG
ncbi:MAG TPA: hypothetical protein VJZ69_01260, partial [Clostridia bacterium]|nr:hypothetical protein [Clostridia bacterium]